MSQVAKNSENNHVLQLIQKTTSELIECLITQQPLVLVLKTSTGSENAIKEKRINFLHKNSTLRFSMFIKCLQIIQNLIQSDSYSTKRDIYYQHKELFRSEDTLSKLIDEISITFNVSRTSLHILASNKGLIAGDIEFIQTDGTTINCQNSITGVIIPNRIDSLIELKSSAKFCLIIEKDATFQRLLNDGFLSQYPNSIMITGKGMPDIDTRKLAHRIWKEFSIPFYCLVDANPFGIAIMAVYKYGSSSLSHEKHCMTVPNLKHLGLSLKDLHELSIEKSNLLKMSQIDRAKAESLLKKPFIKKELDWEHQVNKKLQKTIFVNYLSQLNK